jgi:hypothetical protein
MKTTSVVAAMLVSALSVSAASAQKGVGDTEGIARQPTRPKVVSLSGKVVKMETAPCEMTTGPSVLGTHLMMKTSKGKKLNIHLGPAAAVEFVTRQLSPGEDVRVDAFRTKKMEKGQYVARTLTIDSRTVELRDETLRPAWAGRGGDWQSIGRGARQGWGRGAGYGRRRGAGWQRRGGPPDRRGSCWWWSEENTAWK